jgi:hypothetical protein
VRCIFAGLSVRYSPNLRVSLKIGMNNVERG